MGGRVVGCAFGTDLHIKLKKNYLVKKGCVVMDAVKLYNMTPFYLEAHSIPLSAEQKKKKENRVKREEKCLMGWWVKTTNIPHLKKKKKKMWRKGNYGPSYSRVVISAHQLRVNNKLARDSSLWSGVGFFPKHLSLLDMLTVELCQPYQDFWRGDGSVLMLGIKIKIVGSAPSLFIFLDLVYNEKHQRSTRTHPP